MSDALPKTPGVGGDPCRRPLSFSTLAEAVAEARELEDGYLRCGLWSLGQVCQHLATFMAFSLDGFPGKRLPRPAAWALRTVLLNDRTMRRPMPKGIKAPAFLQPAEGAAGETYSGATDADREAVARFIDVCRRVERHKGAFRPSPVFGALPAAKWRRVHVKHAEHHLGFLVPTLSLDRDAAARGIGAG